MEIFEERLLAICCNKIKARTKPNAEEKVKGDEDLTIAEHTLFFNRPSFSTRKKIIKGFGKRKYREIEDTVFENEVTFDDIM